MPNLSPIATGGTTATLLQDLQGASIDTRNLELMSLLNQLQGPSMTNVYEAGPMDALVRNLREARMARSEGLAQRGLTYSGAAPTASRGVEEGYAGGVLNVATAANQAETARKQSLLSALLGLNQQDLQFLQGLSQAALGTRAASYAEDAQAREQIKQLAIGSATIASIIAGGAAGAAGGAAGGALGGASGVSGGAAAGEAGGLSGAGVGALGAYNIGSKLSGGGTPSYIPPSATPGGLTAATYGGTPTPSSPYGFSIGGDYLRQQITANPEFESLVGPYSY